MLLARKQADKSQGIGIIRVALMTEAAFNLHYAHIVAELAAALGVSGETDQGISIIDRADC
jgi:hypothetical protein